MDIDAHRAQRLFQAVVAQALIDATAPDAPYSTEPLKPLIRKRKAATKTKRAHFIETKKEWLARNAARNVAAIERRKITANAPREEARSWLLSDMENFPRIVSLAGYNPIDIREKARRLAGEGWPTRVRGDDSIALAA